VQGCENCKTHLSVKYYFAIPDGVDEKSIEIELQSHDVEYENIKVNSRAKAKSALKGFNFKIVG